MRLNTAQYLCPELICLPRDPDREGRVFEVVLDAFDSVAAGVVCLRPGLAWAPAAPIVRWSGGQEPAAALVLDAVNDACGLEAFVGLADGPLAAVEAARVSALVDSADTAAFLADIPIERALALLPPALQTSGRDGIALLESLGVRTCAQVRDLGRSALLTRFGQVGEPLWDLVTGHELFIKEGARVERDRSVEIILDEEALIEAILLPVRRGAIDLAAELDSHGLSAHILDIACETADGRTRSRTWTAVEVADPRIIVERVRWQLKGWCDVMAADEGVGAAVVRVVLTARDPRPRPNRTPLWGPGDDIEKRECAAERLQSLLGPDGLTVPRLHGGYDPRTRSSTVPWRQEAPPAPPREGEWEGGVDIAPATLFDEAIRVDVLPAAPVMMSERGILLAEPACLRRLEPGPDAYGIFGSAGLRALTRTGGPWAVRGRWWRPDVGHQSRAYITARLQDGPEILLSLMEGKWWVEGLYG